MDIKAPSSAVYIYGASYLGVALAKVLEQQQLGYEIIDAYAARDFVRGKYLYRPDEVSSEDKANAIVYLAVLLPPLKADADAELFRQLSNMGFAKLISAYETMALFPEALAMVAHDGLLWRNPEAPDYFNPQAFERIIAYFPDQRSKALLSNIANFRQQCSPDNYIVPDIGHEYEPEGIDIATGYQQLNIVDCGAFNGDTINQFFGLFGARIGNYFAYEPEAENFATLRQVADQAKQHYPGANIICLPMGVADSNQVLRFSSGDGAASHISDDGDSEIYVVKLDDVLGHSNVSLIKVDVEGADLAVLQGARQLIERQKPNLAISCYHRPDHIWTIPQYIKELNSNYRMYLRQHGHYGFELTLYCIDESRFAQ